MFGEVAGSVGPQYRHLAEPAHSTGPAERQRADRPAAPDQSQSNQDLGSIAYPTNAKMSSSVCATISGATRRVRR